MNTETLQTLEKIGLHWDGEAEDSYHRLRFDSDNGNVFFIYTPNLDYICSLITGTGICADYDSERRERNLRHELRKAAVFLVGME
jgi:hypothetical protein